MTTAFYILLSLLLLSVLYPFFETVYYAYKPSAFSLKYINEQIRFYENIVNNEKETIKDEEELNYNIDMIDYWKGEKERLEFQIKKGIVKT